MVDSPTKVTSASDLLSRVVGREELIDVQALISQPSVERLYVPVGSFRERFRSELRALIHCDRPRYPGSVENPIQGRDNVAAAEPKPRLYQRREATKLIDHGEHAKWPAIEQLIMNKIHAPALVRALSLQNNSSMQAHVLATADRGA